MSIRPRAKTAAPAGPLVPAKKRPARGGRPEWAPGRRLGMQAAQSNGFGFGVASVDGGRIGSMKLG